MRLQYGDRPVLEGCFLLPQGAADGADAGTQGFEAHLDSLGITHLFLAQNLLSISPPVLWRRWWGKALAVSEQAGNALVHGMSSARHGGMYRAIVLGERDLLEREDREKFVHSGTIHIFSISGMHVNVTGTMLLFVFLFLPLPFRLRCGATLPFLLLYVLLTGASSSAMRAFWMQTIMVISILCRRPGMPSNALAASAIILLMQNPNYLHNNGFRFSFVIVAVLLAGARPLTELCMILTERRRWLPRPLRGHLSHAVSQAFVAMAGASWLAWAGGCGLSLLFNGMFSWGALAANLFLPILILFLFQIAVPKMLLAWLCPPLSLAAGRGLDMLFTVLDLTTSLGGSPMLRQTAAVPSPAMVWGLYALLFMFLLVDGHRLLRLLGLTGFCLLLGICLIRPRPVACEVWLCDGGSGGPPGLCVITPQPFAVHILATGGTDAAIQLAAMLKRRGITEIDTLFLLDSSREMKGAWRLQKLLPASSLAYGIPNPSPRMRRYLKETRGKGIHAAHRPSNQLKITKTPEKTIVCRWLGPSNQLPQLQWSTGADGRTTISIFNITSCIPIYYIYEPSSRPQLRRIH